MKKRTLVIIILAAALLVGYSVIGGYYLNQHIQRDDYSAQIAQASAELQQIPQPPADLAVRLAAAQDSLEEARNAFMLDATNTELVNITLSTANQTGVTVIPLVTKPWVQETVSNQTYSVFRIGIEVTGTYAQLVNFLHELENSEPKTLIIESLTVKAKMGVSLLDGSERDLLPLTISIKIAVYAAPIDEG